MLLTGAPII